MKTGRQGFTLVELIVVIAIIGILATVGVSSYTSILKKSRDTKRVADMKEIMTALTLYYVQHGQYPVAPPSYNENNCQGWDTSNTDGDGDGISFLDPLVEGGYLEKSFRDPQDSTSDACGGHGSTNTGFNYFYYRYPAGHYGCDITRGPYIVLGFGTAESVTGPHLQSQGLICPQRDWHGTLDYVIARFEK